MEHNSKPVIMAIEDDPIILNALVATLGADYDLRVFNTGKTALAYLGGETADLILLDYRLPDMTGFEVLKQLQGNPTAREIPTIFLTGPGGCDSEVAAALELGAVDSVNKPIQPHLLLTRVRLQLELLKHRKHLEALVEERTRRLDDAYRKLEVREDVTLNILAKATDIRDHDTRGHIERTTEFVRVITEDILKHPRPGYVISRQEADDIILSSKLHDLGKIAMPDHVLLKPGALSEEEFNIVKQHPETGERFLSDSVSRREDSFLDTARDIVYAHHERWNGSGYPQGLKGEEIPLSARIVAIADVYDALTTIRPYKKAFSHMESVEVILRNGGTHFDPYLTEIFMRHADEFLQISERIRLSEQRRLAR